MHAPFFFYGVFSPPAFFFFFFVERMGATSANPCHQKHTMPLSERQAGHPLFKNIIQVLEHTQEKIILYNNNKQYQTKIKVVQIQCLCLKNRRGTLETFTIEEELGLG